jgi:hypothetical protein
MRSWCISKHSSSVNVSSTSTIWHYSTIRKDATARQNRFTGGSLSIREQQLGAEHPDTAGSLLNMAAFCYNMERHSQALPLIQRAVQIHEQTLTSDHPTTQAANSWLRAIREAVDLAF